MEKRGERKNIVMSNKCLTNLFTRYNIDNTDDDPLSEQVVEEIRHADAMEVIR